MGPEPPAEGAPGVPGDERRKGKGANDPKVVKLHHREMPPGLEPLDESPGEGAPGGGKQVMHLEMTVPGAEGAKVTIEHLEEKPPGPEPLGCWCILGEDPLCGLARELAMELGQFRRAPERQGEGVLGQRRSGDDPGARGIQEKEDARDLGGKEQLQSLATWL